MSKKLAVYQNEIDQTLGQKVENDKNRAGRLKKLTGGHLFQHLWQHGA